MEGKSQGGTRSKPNGVIRAAEGHDDAVAQRTKEELASIPTCDNGEGPSTDFRLREPAASGVLVMQAMPMKWGDGFQRLVLLFAV